MSTLAWILMSIFVVCAILFFAAMFKVSSENSRREEGYYAAHPPNRKNRSASGHHQLDNDPNVNRCVCCGEIIPEGLQVCSSCEQKQRLGNGWY